MLIQTLSKNYGHLFFIAPKTKSNFVKNRFCVKNKNFSFSLILFLIFPGGFKD